jgi:xylan 1,4-beta-xylosidase
MKLRAAVLVTGLALSTPAATPAPADQPVTIRVDTAVTVGPMHPFWAWFGHDEPNYTYTANGKKLLTQL